MPNIYDGALWEIANGSNYFDNLPLFLQYQLFMFSNSWNKYYFFNAGQIFTPEFFIQCKNLWGRVLGRGMLILNITSGRFTVILLINFDLHYFRT